MLEPILHGWYPAQIVGHVLLADGSHGNVFTVAVPYCGSKNRGAHEDAFTVVPKRPVTEVSEVCLAFIKPIMEYKIVFRFTAE
jgi:hypothetical protein